MSIMFQSNIYIYIGGICECECVCVCVSIDLCIYAEVFENIHTPVKREKNRDRDSDRQEDKYSQKCYQVVAEIPTTF